MKTNKKTFTVVVMIILLVCMAIAPAFADNYATWGNGEETSVFYVVSQGNASVTLRQNEGTCYELSYTHLVDGIRGVEEEWGKYHIYITTPGGYRYTENWDKTFRGGSYTFDLNECGTYKIKVVPYTVNEMTASWTLDQFLSWTTAPTWWVYETNRCYARTSN